MAGVRRKVDNEDHLHEHKGPWRPFEKRKKLKHLLGRKKLIILLFKRQSWWLWIEVFVSINGEIKTLTGFFLATEGRVGGILSMWCGSLFSLKYHFSRKGFLGVGGLWAKNNMSCTIVNVYSSCIILEMRDMWRDLALSKRGFGGEFWCFTGATTGCSELGVPIFHKKFGSH